MKKLTVLLAAMFLTPIGLYVAARRSMGELKGFMRAGADTTLDELTSQIPREVHDRKREQDLAQVRQEMLDRQVQLTQSKNQILQLKKDVIFLTDSLERRQRLLAEAYPVLERAVHESAANVAFANQELPLTEFQHEVDDLLARQEREEKQLTIKRQGLDRLQRSEREAEEALADMRRALDEAALEAEILVARRQQAELEGKTLEMTAAVSSGTRGTDEAVGRSLARLRDEVTGIEAQNEARRLNAPAGSATGNNRLARHWNRLETLKAIHDKATLETTGKHAESTPAAEQSGQPAESQTTKITGAEVRIEIRGEK
ncbi:MAG: hypothetical protein EXS05_20260 [Planctomycetaceae bacterium]|nr:hypothetical protein [Planctomycetaceae bacterium]